MNLENGSRLEGVEVLIEKFSVAKTKKGKDYFNLQVRDKENSVQAKMWNAEISMKQHLKPGSVVYIWADVSEYNNKPQISLSRFELSSSDPADFAHGTRFNVEELWSSICDVVESFEEPLAKALAEELLISDEVIASLMKKAPAATNVHNNWVGGLLEHVWSMIQIAEPIIAHYKKTYRPSLSRDKVLFGVIMHDLGKIVEYDIENPAFPATPTGILTNHIVLGPAWIYNASKAIEKRAREYKCIGKAAFEGDINFKQETAQLMHLVASHHGQFDWGSPVKPATLEAVLLHFLDNMDSKFMHALDLIEKGEGPVQGFSDRSYYEGVHYLIKN